MTTNKFTWHVVSDDVGNILAVRGSALLAEAQEKARAIEHETGRPIFLHSIVGPRPRVGQTISMRGRISRPADLTSAATGAKSSVQEVGNE